MAESYIVVGRGVDRVRRNQRVSECLTPAQIKSLPTAALRLVQHDLRKTLVPDAVRRAQDLQRALVWVDREVGRRKKITGPYRSADDGK